MTVRRITTRCPYCGLENLSMVKFTYQDFIREFVYCDDSRHHNGCGRDYAVIFEMWIKPNVFRLEEPEGYETIQNPQRLGEG